MTEPRRVFERRGATDLTTRTGLRPHRRVAPTSGPHRTSARVRLVGAGVALGVLTLATAACRPVVARTGEPTCRVAAWRETGVPGRHFSTEHFDIYSTLPDAGCESAIPSLLESAYDRFATTLPPRSDARLTTYVFGRRSEWARFTRQRFPERWEVYERIRQGGFTEGSVSASFFVSRSQTLATLIHEAWHQYVAVQLKEPLPAWLNEGLACYHEAVDLAGSAPRFTPEHNTFRMAALRDAVQRNTLLALSELIETNAGAVLARDDEKFTQVYYAQAWALIVFLRHGAGGKYAADFDRLMQDVSQGAFRTKVSAARLTDGRAETSDRNGTLDGREARSRSGRARGRTEPNRARGGTPESAALTADDTALTTDGASAFVAYFHRQPADLQREYFDHLVRVTGF